MGIIAALLGAGLLAIGTELQHVGVAHTGRRLRDLATRPEWLIGAVIIAASVALQLWSLHLTALAIVQPLGALGIVFAAVLQARRTRTRLRRTQLIGITLCLGGIGACVFITSSTASAEKVTLASVVGLTILAGALGAVFSIALHATRSALMPAISAAIMFGFVATCSQVVVNDLATPRFGASTAVALATLTATGIAGAVWVQRAHERGTSTLVLACLTVVDPITGILLTSAFFSALAEITPTLAFLLAVSGLTATAGVLRLAQPGDLG